MNTMETWARERMGEGGGRGGGHLLVGTAPQEARRCGSMVLPKISCIGACLD